VCAGDREGAVADGERHALGRVAPDVARREDARAGRLDNARFKKTSSQKAFVIA